MGYLNRIEIGNLSFCSGCREGFCELLTFLKYILFANDGKNTLTGSEFLQEALPEVSHPDGPPPQPLGRTPSLLTPQKPLSHNHYVILILIIYFLLLPQYCEIFLSGKLLSSGRMPDIA